MTTPKSVIFYLSYTAGPDRTPLTLPSGRTVYIRTEEVVADLLDALDAAQPENDEHVMNSHYCEQPDVFVE